MTIIIVAIIVGLMAGPIGCCLTMHFIFGGGL
jgi:hypothetical protein